ncbi:hypothetical protein BDW22DRAFT_1360632 [Trametopsis cervina]|nr:hypothetical protein BDW22DRAFT_1360632 [Trametopsis cervina]
MQVARLCTRPLRTAPFASAKTRFVVSRNNSTTSSTLPWFVDPSDVPPKPPTPGVSSEYQLSTPEVQHEHFHQNLAPLPTEIPAHSPLARLHANLSASPFLEPGTLLVTRPVPTDPGPPLPASGPRGRRKRGRTYVGEGMEEEGMGLWQWMVLAQVKEGTEKRGAIESVVRQVRQSLLKETPPVLLPPRRREIKDGWAMIDAGDFAVHIVSKTARERFFPPERRTWSLSY